MKGQLLKEYSLCGRFFEDIDVRHNKVFELLRLPLSV